MTQYVKADGTLTDLNEWQVDEAIVRCDLSVLCDGLSEFVPPRAGGGAGSGISFRSRGQRMPRSGEKVHTGEGDGR